MNVNLPIYSIQLTNVERLLFIKTKTCLPIGYDKYHFLYSKGTNHNNVNVNSLKHNLHHRLRDLMGNEKATQITNALIKNQITYQHKKELCKNIEAELVNFYNPFNKKYKNMQNKIKKIINSHFNKKN